MTSTEEITRRYALVRSALDEDNLDALIVCGTEYTGFEGAIRWVSGFRIVHRYAFVVIPRDGEPFAVFPAEARWVGDHGDCWIEEQFFPEEPGAWLHEHANSKGWRDVAVYGVNHIMPAKDHTALGSSALNLVDYGKRFDLLRAVKSDEELRMVRESFAINEEGFWALLAAYEPGRTQADILSAAEEHFVRRGAGRTTMNMVISGSHGAAAPEFRHADAKQPVEKGDLLLYSLEIAGPSGYWAEFARPICREGLSRETHRMMEAYQAGFDQARASLRAGNTAHDVHAAVFRCFEGLDVKPGHVTGHSIDMVMVAHPRIGEGEETELEENMIISIHPHVVTSNEKHCLYLQETFRVGPDGGEQLSSVPIVAFDGSER